MYLGWITVRRTQVTAGDDRGAALMEWALLVILIAIVALIAVKFTGQQNSALWSTIADSVTSP